MDQKVDLLEKYPYIAEMKDFDPEAFVISKTVEINAPASVVWDILIDMENYPKWNPFCVECESTLEMGAPVKMKLKSYVNAGPDFFENTEFVCAFEPEKLLSWELPLFDMWPYPARRDQVIEATGPNSCRYYSTDAFLGENGIHVMRFAGPWVKQAFDDTADALKERARVVRTKLKQFDNHQISPKTP